MLSTGRGVSGSFPSLKEVRKQRCVYTQAVSLGQVHFEPPDNLLPFHYCTIACHSPIHLKLDPNLLLNKLVDSERIEGLVSIKGILKLLVRGLYETRLESRFSHLIKVKVKEKVKG